jgi:hypothetical protein
LPPAPVPTSADPPPEAKALTRRLIFGVLILGGVISLVAFWFRSPQEALLPPPPRAPVAAMPLPPLVPHDAGAPHRAHLATHSPAEGQPDAAVAPRQRTLDMRESPDDLTQDQLDEILLHGGPKTNPVE